MPANDDWVLSDTVFILCLKQSVYNTEDIHMNVCNLDMAQ